MPTLISPTVITLVKRAAGSTPSSQLTTLRFGYGLAYSDTTFVSIRKPLKIQRCAGHREFSQASGPILPKAIQGETGKDSSWERRPRL